VVGWQARGHINRRRHFVDLSRLSKGDRIIGASGIMLFAVSFANWLGIEITGDQMQFGEPATWTYTKSAWSFPVAMIAVILGLAMVVIVALKAMGANFEKIGPASTGQVLLVLGAATFLLVAVKLIAGPAEWNFAGEALKVSDINGFCRFRLPQTCQTFTETRGAGIIFGTVAAAGLLLGGYMRNQEDSATSSPAPARTRATSAA
jgi:hypothetical protein